MGESVKLFRKSYPNGTNYKIISFEPNPAMQELFAAQGFNNVELRREAIWTHNGTITFYNEALWTISSTLHRENRYVINKHLNIEVPCIDFSRWLLERFSPNDHIILKLDIEGSEYEVLNKMIVDNSIGLINKLYIEWHPTLRKLEPSANKVQERLLAELESRNIKCLFWHAATENPTIEDVDVKGF